MGYTLLLWGTQTGIQTATHAEEREAHMLVAPRKSATTLTACIGGCSTHLECCIAQEEQAGAQAIDLRTEAQVLVQLYGREGQVCAVDVAEGDHEVEYG